MVCRHLILILSPLKTNDGSKIQVRGCHVLYGIPMQRISTSSWIEVSYELLRYYENQRIHSRTQIGALTSLILSEPGTQTLLHVQPHKIDGNTSISNRYQTLWDCVESYTMRTCLSSLFSSETTLKLIIIFLSNHINIYLLLSYVKKASSIISQRSAQDSRPPVTDFPTQAYKANAAALAWMQPEECDFFIICPVQEKETGNNLVCFRGQNFQFR